MRIDARLLMLGSLLAATIGTAHAHPSYTGYSGAPGSNGFCASSCHGSSGGTIVVTGFPAQYDAGQTYTINVSHNGGNMIKQFNASCRLGTGSANAGVIAAGSNTVTYSTAGETNGVHLVALDTMGGSFTWTAPASGSGNATLYLAGHQGSSGGANTTLSFTATEATVGVNTRPAGAVAFALEAPTPNPVMTEASLRYVLPHDGVVSFEVFDLWGRSLERRVLAATAGSHELRWNATGRPSGVYFCRLEFSGMSATRRMLVAR